MPQLTDGEMDDVGEAITTALPQGKHFVCLVIGEGPTKLEIVSDIYRPELIAKLCLWAKDVVTGQEDEESANAVVEICKKPN